MWAHNPTSVYEAIGTLISQKSVYTNIGVNGVIAFRLIAPSVGSNAEPQPKSN